MKGHIFCIAVVAVMGISVPCLAARRIDKVGLKAGWNYSTVVTPTGSAERAHWIRTGTIGGYVSYSITRKFGLQIEILYLTNGWEDELEGSKIKFELHYLQMPILAKVLTRQNKHMSFAFLFGPTVARKLNQTLPTGAGLEINTDIFDNHHFDMGFTVGGDLGLKGILAKGELIIAPRYYWGITKIGRVRNRAFTLMIGYAI